MWIVSRYYEESNPNAPGNGQKALKGLSIVSEGSAPGKQRLLLAEKASGSIEEFT